MGAGPAWDSWVHAPPLWLSYSPSRAAAPLLRGGPLPLCPPFLIIRPPYGTTLQSKQVAIEAHRHQGIFIARGKEDALVTKNMVPGESVYGEKRISVEGAEVRARRSEGVCEVRVESGTVGRGCCAGGGARCSAQHGAIRDG